MKSTLEVRLQLEEKDKEEYALLGNKYMLQVGATIEKEENDQEHQSQDLIQIQVSVVTNSDNIILETEWYSDLLYNLQKGGYQYIEFPFHVTTEGEYTLIVYVFYQNHIISRVKNIVKVKREV